MEKIDVLKNIRAARRSHTQWVDKAKSLVNGLEVKKEQIPLEVTECSFGKWFYCDGQILLSFFTEEAIEKLDSVTSNGICSFLTSNPFTRLFALSTH